MIIICLDKEREFKEGEVITLSVDQIAKQPVIQTYQVGGTYMLRCSELGPSVPVDEKLAETFKVNAELVGFVKSIAEIEQVTGSTCPLCRGWQEHREGCLYVKAQQLIANLALEAVLGPNFKKHLGGQ